MNMDPKVYEFYLRGPVVHEAPLKGVVAFVVYLIPTLLKLARFLRQNNIELVSLEYPLPPALYFLLLRSLMSFKVIVGLHGDDVLSLHLLSKVDQWVVRRTVRRADWILAHSSSLLQKAREILNMTHDRQSYISLGVECSRLRGYAKQFASHIQLPPKPYALTVAKLYERKAIDVLLVAIQRLSNRRCNFVIVGDGPEEDRLKRMALELGIEKRVTFCGDIPNIHIPALVEQCEIFVLPSRSEPFGLVLLEAMTFGKPIVASKVGGIPEFIEDERNGLLVPPEDSALLAEKIDLLLNDPKLQTKLGHEALMSVESLYDYTKLVQKYEDLFRRVVGA
jgi:glycosyltransferase involved in cell wall biosynthesis